MAKSPFKDDTLDVLDFVLSVIKEHDKDLGKLVNELASIAKLLGEKGELSGRLGRIEDKIDSIHNDINNLLKSLPTSFQ